MFDFGRASNLAKYGSATPPPYNLTKVRASVVIFHSIEDWVSPLEVTMEK